MKVTKLNLSVMSSWLEDNQRRLVEVQKPLFRLHNNFALFLPLAKDNDVSLSIPLNFSTDRYGSASAKCGKWYDDEEN